MVSKHPIRIATYSLTEDTRLHNTNVTYPIVSGEHAFKAPDFANGDQRGPCPGLNALANHGYIPHNGVVSVCSRIVIFVPFKPSDLAIAC